MSWNFRWIFNLYKRICQYRYNKFNDVLIKRNNNIWTIRNIGNGICSALVALWLFDSKCENIKCYRYFAFKKEVCRNFSFDTDLPGTVTKWVYIVRVSYVTHTHTYHKIITSSIGKKQWLMTVVLSVSKYIDRHQFSDGINCDIC